MVLTADLRGGRIVLFLPRHCKAVSVEQQYCSDLQNNGKQP